MAENSLYAIGIGGTGAKCLEALIQMAAVGLFAEQPMRMLFIDADESNGNLARAKSSLAIYQQCYALLEGEKQQCSWLKTPLENYELWSPFGNDNINKTLSAFFNYNSLRHNNEALGNLFDVLYTKDERDINLDVGFRGRPAIGSAIMSQLDLDDLDGEPWKSLLDRIKADVGSGRSVKIFLCGSIFGGTGASGLPTIGRLIHNKLKKESIRDRINIACLFVLPYFQFPVPSTTDFSDSVYARSEKFLLNTEAALRYYRTQARECFNSVYLLGNQNFSNFDFSIGHKTQRNAPHFIELYAALAARNFFTKDSLQEGEVVLNNRQNGQKIVWQDLPDLEAVRPALINATRFAYIWLANLKPELDTAREIGVGKFQNGAPWFVKFFRSKGFWSNKELPDFNDEFEQKAIEIISNWCRDYLRWLAEIHQCDGDELELFQYKILTDLDGQLKGEFLKDIVCNDTRENVRKSQDTVRSLKEQLNPRGLPPPNQGTAGLAKNLYILCNKF